MFKLLKAERMKLKRSPVWLAFLLMPVLPAILGTMNYLNNKELLTTEWYSLWTQHTLFTSYFFLPVMVGIYCAYLMRLEHANHNWNKVLTMPYGRSGVFIAKLLTAAKMLLLTEIWIGALFVISGHIAGLTNPPIASIVVWCAFGTLGGIVMAAVQLLISMFIKSFALPVGISFAGGISGLLAIAKHFGHVWVYSLMAYGMHANSNVQQLTAEGNAQFVIISVLYIAFITAVGVLMIQKQDI